MKNLNVHGFAYARLHSKYVLLDCHTVITGSANLTDHGVSNNIENVVMPSQEALVASYMKNFEDL